MWGIPDATKVARDSHRYCEDAGASYGWWPGIDQEIESLASVQDARGSNFRHP